MLIIQKNKTVLYLKRGANIFVDVDCFFIVDYFGEYFTIKNHLEALEVNIPYGPDNKTQSPISNYNHLVVFNESSLPFHVYIFFHKIRYIADLVSILLEDVYLDVTPFDFTSINQGVIMGAKTILKRDYSYEGIKTSNFEVPQKNINTFFKKIKHLSEEDLGFFRSACHLITDAKKRLYKGENAGAITSAVSAVEALYLRKDPAQKNYWSLVDSRFSISQKKASAFKDIVRYKDGVRSEKIFDNLPSDPYAIRSGYLHGGQIDFYQGAMPRRNDEYLQFILLCQEVVRDSLSIFLEK